MRASIKAFLAALAAFPDQAQTLLVEVVGAGPRAMARRDRALDQLAEHLTDTDSALRSTDDAYAIAGAVAELASRQLRTGRPERLEDLEPLVERFVAGLTTAP